MDLTVYQCSLNTLQTAFKPTLLVAASGTRGAWIQFLTMKCSLSRWTRLERWTGLEVSFFFSRKCQWGVNYWISKQQRHMRKYNNTWAAHAHWRLLRWPSQVSAPTQRADTSLSASRYLSLCISYRRTTTVCVESRSYLLHSCATQESRDSVKTLGWPTLPTAVNRAP